MGVDDLIRAVKKIESDPSDTTGGNEDFYSWSFEDFGAEYRMICYCMQKALKSIDKNYFIYLDDVSGDFEYDEGKSESIVLSGGIAFHSGSKNYVLEFDHKVSSITLSGKNNVRKIRTFLDDYIKFNNPLKRKNVQLSHKCGDLVVTFHAVDPMPWSSLILDSKMKQEIWDNTIFHLENMDQNNGLIFHGPVGLGKSSACRSLIYEVAQRGYSSCFTSSVVDFTTLSVFIRKYMAPCLVIFEDIDGFAGKREEKDNPDLAGFLQLINGLHDDKNKIIFIATTNLLSYLDASVADRPMRFNRKYLFDYPGHNEINQLVDLFFGSGEHSIPAEQKALCYDCKMGGAHIKEIKRTADIMSLKNNKPTHENFAEAVKEVKSSFNKTEATVGFGYPSRKSDG